MTDAPATPLKTHDGFVDFVLRSALTAPEAVTDPGAGRFLARLLGLMAAECGDDVLAPYLAPMPGQNSTFEVRLFYAGNLDPVSVTSEVGPVAAIKTALRQIRETDFGVEVFSRQLSPRLERCVLVRDITDRLEFRYASAETLIGHPDACSEALRAWEFTLHTWARDLARRSDRASPSHLVTGPTPMVGYPSENGTAESSPVLGLGAVVDALEEFFSNLTVEVDLKQVEHLVRQAAAQDRRDIIDPIAERVVAMLATSLPAGLPAADTPVGQDYSALIEPIAERVAEILRPSLRAGLARLDAAPAAQVVVGSPAGAEVANAVSAQIGALLSETILSRRHADGGSQGSALRAVAAAVERMEVRLDGLEAQAQKSAGLLQTMGDHLNAGARRAAVAERITTSLDLEMHRLAARIDEQVVALTASATGGSELADGVARLTRKLRQSVVQLDRALVRFDELFDHANGIQDISPVAPPDSVVLGAAPLAPPRQPRLAVPRDPMVRG